MSRRDHLHPVDQNCVRSRLATFLLVASISLIAGCDSEPTAGASDFTGAEPPPAPVRVATFNIAMGLPEAGALSRRLADGDDEALQKIAEVIQIIRPDILLLNEFDYDPATDAAALFNTQYLGNARSGLEPVAYPYSYRAGVNTGLDSGLDLNQDGKLATPADTWGFGLFPGQYGMLVLSQFPIDTASVRTFQKVLWAEQPGASPPVDPDTGDAWYSEEHWPQLRLSSKSIWDVPVRTPTGVVHLLASHPTPPVFDGKEDRNGLRNRAEIQFLLDYVSGAPASYLVDDKGNKGGLSPDVAFVVAGDLNADPFDGDSLPEAINQLIESPFINADCVPASEGAERASSLQGGINANHRGPARFDTADFSDTQPGNLRLDYVLPARSLTITQCGVFWPGPEDEYAHLATLSDHHLVWVDILLEPSGTQSSQ